MNRKMIGWPNEANASRASATPSGTASAGPSSAVAASGIASVIQNTMTSTKIAASRWASGCREEGEASVARNSGRPEEQADGAARAVEGARFHQLASPGRGCSPRGGWASPSELSGEGRSSSFIAT